MDIGRAITFFSEDDHWIQKVGIGIGVVLISMLLSPLLVGFIGFFILGGYAIRLLQNVRDGEAQPLPEWDDWGGDLARGFKYVIVTLVWSLAAYLMMVPMFIGGALADSGDVGAFIGSAIMICTSCLLMLYGIFVALASPGFTISFAHDEHIGSGLKVTKIWRWTQANLGQVIIVMLVVFAVSFVVSMLAGLLGLILCVIGLAVTIPFSVLFLTLFQYNLYGQLAREHPMYDSPSADPGPLLPSGPVVDDVAPTLATALEPDVIIPPAPADAIDDAGEAVEAVATGVVETSDEISADVDDIVEASAEVSGADEPSQESGEVTSSDDDQVQKSDG